MAERFDTIVVGSGFGGAVTACRLAEAGDKVLVLERGRRWTPETYPRTLSDPWLFHTSHPEKHNGWLDLRFFGGMTVAQGAGVGGGSLCYSSVVMEADPEAFQQGWPREITYGELKPEYDKVREMLALRPIPAGQRTHRYQLLRRAAEALGYGDRLEDVPLAVSFDEDYSYELEDPINPRYAKSFRNDQGVEQRTCVHLGNCDIGCDVQAKNTLDLNYIPRAERHGAEVRPLHMVRYLEPSNGGYRVHFRDLEKERDGQMDALRVILAAGSLGSTEILLRCRDQYGTLPRVSERLGYRWSANANFLTPASYPEDVEVHQGIGPTISAGLNFMDGSIAGERFYVEDDGFPNLLLNALEARIQSGGFKIAARLLRRRLRRGLDEKNPAEQLMVWLGEGLDAADGRLYLGRRLFPPWRKKLKLDWDYHGSRGVIEAVLEVHRRLTEVENGRLQIPLYWRFLRNLVTVHPLGGCAMAEQPSQGVTDHRGQVFGYPDLYVADGALLPRPTGRNPSMTIAALAERISRVIIEET